MSDDVEMTNFSLLFPCKHDWHIWPETDGLEQRCSKCGEYRRTPEEDKFWLKEKDE